MEDSAQEFERGRSRWLALAYRMVGTRADAEEIVQEAWVRVSSASAQIEDLEAYTTRVVTRLCVDHLRSARVRREAYVGPWLPEPVRSPWGDVARGDPEQDVALAESVRLAFLRTLESLTPVERAVFLLREVFGYGYDEVAALVERREDACRQLASRARAKVRDGRVRRDVTRVSQERLLMEFIGAVSTGDVAGLEALLAEDAVMWSDGGGKVHAALRPVRGARKIARFFMAQARKIGGEISVEVLNGSPTLVLREEGAVVSAMSFESDDGVQVAEVYIVRNPDKLSGL